MRFFLQKKIVAPSQSHERTVPKAKPTCQRRRKPWRKDFVRTCTVCSCVAETEMGVSMGNPQNGWLIMASPMKMDDFEVLIGTPISGNFQIYLPTPNAPCMVYLPTKLGDLWGTCW